tara:strand:+ start:144 stop:578 length:435 start_codon:yes stop_codon:yes gene_type:complete
MDLNGWLKQNLHKCRRCNRPLTDDKSIEEGIGPQCRAILEKNSERLRKLSRKMSSLIQRMRVEIEAHRSWVRLKEKIRLGEVIWGSSIIHLTIQQEYKGNEPYPAALDAAIVSCERAHKKALAKYEKLQAEYKKITGERWEPNF